MVSLPDMCVAALRRHRVRQIQDKSRALPWVETAFLFTTGIGTPLDGETVGRRLRKLTVAAGLPPLRFHDLQHSAASAEITVELFEVETISAAT